MASNRWNKNRKFAHEYKSTGSYDIEQRAGETDMQYYRRLAKVADQRLVRLEKLSKQKDFRGVKKMAYGRAMADLEIFGGKRFNTAPPQDRRLFKEKIMAMRYFIESPTSTKRGIIETYSERAKALNKKYGTDFTWQDLASFFGSGKADKMMNGRGESYGSKTVIKAIGRIQLTAESVIKGIQENTSIKTDDPITDAALSILRRNFKIPGYSLTTAERRRIRERLRGQNA